jgi:hypothetical protein
LSSFKATIRAIIPRIDDADILIMRVFDVSRNSFISRQLLDQQEIQVDYSISYVAEEVSQGLGAGGNISSLDVQPAHLLTQAASSGNFQAKMQSIALQCGVPTDIAAALQVPATGTSAEVVSRTVFTLASRAPSPYPSIQPTVRTSVARDSLSSSSLTLIVSITCAALVALMMCALYWYLSRPKIIKKCTTRLKNDTNVSLQRKMLFTVADSLELAEMFESEEEKFDEMIAGVNPFLARRFPISSFRQSIPNS